MEKRAKQLVELTGEKASYLRDRMKEPSTYSSLLGLATLWGLPSGVFDVYWKSALTVLGIIAVLLKERHVESPQNEF